MLVVRWLLVMVFVLLVVFVFVSLRRLYVPLNPKP